MRSALFASASAAFLLMTGCATAPKPEIRVIEVCPAIPALELDAPARDYLDQMRSFLSGLLPTPLGLRPPSMPAGGPTTTSGALKAPSR